MQRKHSCSKLATRPRAWKRLSADELSCSSFFLRLPGCPSLLFPALGLPTAGGFGPSGLWFSWLHAVTLPPHSAPPNGRSVPGSVPGPCTASALRKLSIHGGAVMTATELVSSHTVPSRGAERWGRAGREGSHTVDGVVREGLHEVAR